MLAKRAGHSRNRVYRDSKVTSHPKLNIRIPRKANNRPPKSKRRVKQHETPILSYSSQNAVATFNHADANANANADADANIDAKCKHVPACLSKKKKEKRCNGSHNCVTRGHTHPGPARP
jgi:hypothetical protein